MWKKKKISPPTDLTPFKQLLCNITPFKYMPICTFTHIDRTAAYTTSHIKTQMSLFPNPLPYKQFLDNSLQKQNVYNSTEPPNFYVCFSVTCLCALLSFSLHPRSGELRTQKLKSHLVRTQSLNVLSFKPGVG